MPPGSDWCGNKKRSQGGEKGTLSGGKSTACHRNCKGGNMSGLPSEPLRKGAVSKECWVLNPAVGPKVTLRKISVGPTATVAEAAAASVKCAGEPVPGSELPPAARQAAWETESLPAVMASGPIPPTAAPVKRKAKAGVTGGSQKRKKSSPAKVKDL